MNKDRAFTLLELLMVLALAALLATLVVVAFRGPSQRSQMLDVLDALRSRDRMARHTARRFDRQLRLVFDLDCAMVGEVDPAQLDRRRAPYSLPSGYRLSQVAMMDRRVVSGQVALACSSIGWTPSYALLVEGPAGQKRWILWAGTTGEFMEAEDEKQVNGPLAAIRTARSYVD